MKNKLPILFLGLALGIGSLLCIADTPIFAPGNSTLSFQSGSNVTANVFLFTNAFNPAFTSVPAVVVTPLGVNSPTNFLVTVTTSNFVVQLSATNQNFSWIAAGSR
jgi:hypothetical protein